MCGCVYACTIAGGMPDDTRLLRHIPSVERLLRSESGRALLGAYAHTAVVDALRDEWAAVRDAFGEKPMFVLLSGVTCRRAPADQCSNSCIRASPWEAVAGHLQESAG